MYTRYTLILYPLATAANVRVLIILNGEKENHKWRWWSRRHSPCSHTEHHKSKSFRFPFPPRPRDIGETFNTQDSILLISWLWGLYSRTPITECFMCSRAIVCSPRNIMKHNVPTWGKGWTPTTWLTLNECIFRRINNHQHVLQPAVLPAQIPRTIHHMVNRDASAVRTWCDHDVTVPKEHREIIFLNNGYLLTTFFFSSL